MLKPRDSQGSFLDTEYICEDLIPEDSFYRKFREVVWPLVTDEMFVDIYCNDNGQAADTANVACNGDHHPVSPQPL